MKTQNAIIYLLFITACISCQENRSHKTNSDSTITSNNKYIKSSDSISNEEYSDGEDVEQAIARSTIESTFKDRGLNKMFDREADINNDSIMDRLVIPYDTNETDEKYRYGIEAPIRPLYILTGLKNNRYKILLVSNNAIPKYYCNIVGSPFTELENIVFNDNDFSFSYTNTTDFYYHYYFTYEKKQETFVLDKVFIKYHTVAMGKLENITLTQKDLGRHPLEFFNPDKLDITSHLEKRYPDRFN